MRLFGLPDYAATVRISTDGTADLPLIGPILLDYLTVADAELAIRKRLISAGMYRSPEVFIQLSDTPQNFATLTGEMHGIVPLTSQRRLLDVLSLAGGIPPTASRVVYISRPGNPELLTLDLSGPPELVAKNNIPIQPHDTIIVRSAGAAYFVGAFRQQGAIPLVQGRPLTLLQGLSIVQGFGWEGVTKDVQLIRMVGTERTVIPVDLHKIEYGQEPDPTLEADDIVFLPTDKMRQLIKNGGLGTVLGLASILVFAVHN